MDRRELLEKLILARPCLSTQDIVPILSHFCFTEEEIIAFNGIQGIIVDYENDLECALPGELLMKLLGSYKAETIGIKKKGKEVAVKAGKSNAKLASLSEDDYIFEFPDTDEAKGFKLTEDFLTGIRRTLISVSNNSLQRSQYGITLTSDKSGAQMYSTDNQRISRYSLEKAIFKKDKVKVLLPEAFCQLLLDVSKSLGETDADVYIGEDFIYAEFNGVYVYSKLLLDVDFLDFKSILDNYYSGDDDDFQEVPDAFITAIERTTLLTSKESDQLVQLSAEDDVLQVSGSSAFGEIREDITFEEDVAEEEIAFRMDANLLLGSLNAVDEMAFRPLASKGSAHMFVGKSDNFLHLLMGIADEED